jgi:hypothetical protein
MKFALIIYICSTLHQVCMPEIKSGEFLDMYDCAIAGYEKSSNVLKSMERKDFIKEQLIVNFRCVEIKHDNI